MYNDFFSLPNAILVDGDDMCTLRRNSNVYIKRYFCKSGLKKCKITAKSPLFFCDSML